MTERKPRKPHVCRVTFDVDVHLDGEEECMNKPVVTSISEGGHLHIMQDLDFKWSFSGKPIVMRRAEP